jgi:Zn-dependent protease
LPTLGKEEREMLQFRLLGIPVQVLPLFFLTALLIGPHDLRGAALWIPIVFTGVLAHELGHAAAIRKNGFAPAIQLHGFGGATTWSAHRPLSPATRIFISAAGPAVGIAIGLIALAVARVMSPDDPVLRRLMWYVVWVNLGWGVLNLLPVLPLDGGVIVTAVAEGLWGSKGRRVARMVSLAACAALGMWALTRGWWWSTILAAVLAVANFQALRSEMGQPDRRDDPFDRGHD